MRTGHSLVIGVAVAILGATHALPVRDEIRDQQWHLDALHINEAHAITKGRGVTVGVVDTGVDATHPDLSGTVVPGTDFAGLGPGDGTEDRDGHGTAMAGLIAAHGRAMGVAPESKILPVRVLFTQNVPTSSATAGVDWAVDHGATVLCLAFGQPDDPALRDALDRAARRDVVAIASIGNEPDHTKLYPGLYPSVVAVAGTDRDSAHAALSVTGTQALLAAPAVGVLSTEPLSIRPTGYAAGDGTSNSAAIVAGVAALVRSKYPNLSAAEVIHRMTATADDKGPPGRDNEYGYGIVNPVKALTADVPPLTPSAEPTIAASPPPDAGGSTSTLVIIGAVVLALLLGTGLVVMLRRRTA